MPSNSPLSPLPPSGTQKFDASAPMGRTTFGAYELIARIGVGGMGEAFLAARAARSGGYHVRKLCVLKRLHLQLATEEHSRARFAQEARVAARLNHPNVVQTYDAGDVAGVPYLAMEFLEGQTLRSFAQACTATGILPDPLLWARIVADALAGLEHVHGLRDFDGTPLGVVHRDVSPHNIFVTYSGRVALIDFGMLKLVNGDHPSLCHTLAGKPRYIAPEYVASGAVDRRADVFSMGVVLWEALAGRVMPVASMSTLEACAPRPSLASVGTSVDDALEAIVARAVSINPASRFASARAMREALEAYIDDAGPAPCREDIGESLASYFANERARMKTLVARGVGDLDALPVDEFPSDRWDVRRRPRDLEESRVHVRPFPDVRFARDARELADDNAIDATPSHARARLAPASDSGHW
jgi:serine/threonine protein kinase